MTKIAGLLGLVFLLFAPVRANAQNQDAVLGKWLNGKHNAQIEITKADGKYFGRIVWLKEPVYPADDKKGMAGKQKVDRESSDPTRHSTPLLGLLVLRNFVFGGNNLWEQGNIYDPDNGKDYRCKMTLTSADVLNVRGFIGISLIGRTDVWTRVK
jgi:uncharacterized protein (DUF2147 family)